MRLLPPQPVSSQTTAKSELSDDRLRTSAVMRATLDEVINLSAPRAFGPQIRLPVIGNTSSACSHGWFE